MKGLPTKWMGDAYAAVVKKLKNYSIVIVVALVVYQCSEAGDITVGSDQILSDGIWSVNGFTIGDAFEETPFAHEMKRMFTKKPDMPSSHNFTVGGYDPFYGLVEFDEDGRVVKVVGNSLLLDGEMVVMRASSTRKIKKRLGKGYIVKQYKSTGHDMGAWMRKHQYTEHHYNDNKKTQLVLYTNSGGYLYEIVASSLEDH